MNIAFTLFIVVMLLVIFAFVRLEVVHAARRAQADETHGWKDTEDFDEQMLDLRKWTHRQFYPRQGAEK